MFNVRLKGRIQARVVIGSRAYGLNTADSDTDIRGFYIPPPWMAFELFDKPPEQLEFAVKDHPNDKEVFWEFSKYLNLLLKANPTVLETLYTPIVEQKTEIYDELRYNRECFISKRAYNTYRGYAQQQLKKMREPKDGSIDWKNAMHVLRLLQVGTTLFETGEPSISADLDRATLLRVRAGEVSLGEFGEMALEAEAKFDRVYEHTDVPNEPNTEWVTELYRAVIQEEFSKEAKIVWT